VLKEYEPIMSWSLFVRKAVICGVLAVAVHGFTVEAEVLNPQSEYPIAGALPGDQNFPCAAITSAGGCLVWQDNSVSPLGLRVRSVRLDGNLNASGVPFAVSSAASSKTAGDQEKPQAAALFGGGTVFVWQGGKVGAQQIYARFLGAGGTFLTSDIRVSKFTKFNQINPAVVTLGDGSVIVVWSSFGQDGSRQGVFAQHFSAAGARLGTEFQVNQFTPNNQRTPAIAALANGNFVVVWISELERSTTSVDVYGRIFNSSGAAFTDEFPINSSTSNLCANPTVAGSANGFAVAWSQQDTIPLAAGSVNGPVGGTPTVLSTNGWDIFGSCFDLNGTARTNVSTRLNTYTFGDQFAPKISALGANYLTVWTSLVQDGSWEGVFGRAFDEQGDFLGAELPVNVTTFSRQIQPTVAANGSDRFLAVWSSFVVGGRYEFDLFARQFLQPTGP
jgi:hypothetical protein